MTRTSRTNIMTGSFSPEALEAYRVLVSNFLPLDFSEGETYDFTRCVRPDGTAYGTKGKCRKGTEEAKGPEAKKNPKTKNPQAKINDSLNKLKEKVKSKVASKKAAEPEKSYAQLMKQQQDLVNKGDMEGAIKLVGKIQEAAKKVAEDPEIKAQIKESETKAQAKEEFEIVQEKRDKRQLAAKLDKKDKIAIRDYTNAYFEYGRSYDSLNTCLRVPPNCTDARVQKKFAKDMDTALSKLPKNDDGDEFYRSVPVYKGAIEVLYNQLKEAKPGMRMKDPGFGSYSSSRKQAESFSSPKRKRIIFISRNKNLTPINMYSEMKHENEAVLPRGIEQTIRKITQDGETLIVEID